MSNLMVEMSGALAASMLLGVGVGWWLRALRQPAAVSVVERPSDQPSEADSNAEKLREMEAQIEWLESQLAAHDSRVVELSEELRVARSEAGECRSQLAATAAELGELQAVHADCDFAFSALRDQIVTLRAKVADLELSAREAEADLDGAVPMRATASGGADARIA